MLVHCRHNFVQVGTDNLRNAIRIDIEVERRKCLYLSVHSKRLILARGLRVDFEEDNIGVIARKVIYFGSNSATGPAPRSHPVNYHQPRAGVDQHLPELDGATSNAMY